MVSSGSERSFRPDTVSSSSEIQPKAVESVPDKVADKVDTVDEVVKKVEEPVVESNTVESDSLNEPNKNDEKTPELLEYNNLFVYKNHGVIIKTLRQY